MHCQLSFNSLHMHNLPTSKLQQHNRWGYDPYTLACKARPSFDRCGTSLSVSLSLSLSLLGHLIEHLPAKQHAHHICSDTRLAHTPLSSRWGCPESVWSGTSVCIAMTRCAFSIARLQMRNVMQFSRKCQPLRNQCWLMHEGVPSGQSFVAIPWQRVHKSSMARWLVV